MKILCGKCKEEMKDFGTYFTCRSGKCDLARSSRAIPSNFNSIVINQMSGDIILIDDHENN